MRATITPTGSGSMRDTLRSRSNGRHYTVKECLASAARSLGLAPGTVEQGVYGRDQWHQRVAVIVAQLVAGGQDATAEEILAPIDAARSTLLHTHLHQDLLTSHQRADGLEDEKQVLFLTDPNPTTWASWRRELVKDIALTKQVVQAGDSQWGGA